jgi:hypothetical protein
MTDLNNIFSNKKTKANSNYDEKIGTQTKAILTVIQRQKDLESSIDNLFQKTDLNSQTLSKNSKKFFNEIKTLKEDNFELRKKIKILETFNSKLIKQIKLFSTKDETKKLEKYIDLWDPMQFVNRIELEEHTKKTQQVITKIIEEFLNEPDLKK